jgi:hypothetical protein
MLKTHFKANSPAVSALFTFIVTCLAIDPMGTAWAGIEFDSRQLLMKDAEQISDLVKTKIQRAEKIQAARSEDETNTAVAAPEAIDQLKDGARIILSRPDQDGSRAKVFGRLRSELLDLNSFYEVLDELTQEALAALKNSQTPMRHQGTYVVLLENLLAEIKPEVAKSEDIQKIVIRIRDSDLKISESLKRRSRLDSMSVLISPSETAAKILPKNTDQKKK